MFGRAGGERPGCRRGAGPAAGAAVSPGRRRGLPGSTVTSHPPTPGPARQPALASGHFSRRPIVVFKFVWFACLFVWSFSFFFLKSPSAPPKPAHPPPSLSAPPEPAVGGGQQLGRAGVRLLPRTGSPRRHPPVRGGLPCRVYLCGEPHVSSVGRGERVWKVPENWCFPPPKPPPQRSERAELARRGMNAPSSQLGLERSLCFAGELPRLLRAALNRQPGALQKGMSPHVAEGIFILVPLCNKISCLIGHAW